MKMFTMFLASLAVLALAFVAMAQDQPAPTTQPAATTQPADAPQTEVLPPGVLAKVNDSVLTQQVIDAQRKYQMIPEYAKLPEIVNRWIDAEIKAQEARRLGLDRDPDIKANLTAVNTQVLAHMLIKHLQNQVQVTEAEMREFYDNNSDDRTFHEENILSFELIATKDKQAAMDIKKQLDSREPWAELLKSHEVETCNITGLTSATITDMRGEDIGTIVGPQFLRNAMIAARRKSTKPSKPLRFHRGKGWALLKIIESKPGALKPFDQVQKLLEQRMISDKKRAIIRELPQQLKDKANIVQAPETLLTTPRRKPATGPAIIEGGPGGPKPPQPPAPGTK